jgi:DNA-binding NarL/FixJ family response regulator
MASAKKVVTVLLADDQTLFREGIKDLLEDERGIKIVGEAADGEEAVRQAKRLNPDVILMDIKLPKMDGISATRQIRKSCPEANVLMLSSFEDEAHIMEALQAGANGYLSKMLPAVELVNAIKTFSHEGMMIPQQMMQKLLTGLRQSDISAPHSNSIKLTKSEIKILDALGKGKSNKDVASEFNCSIKTIKNHLNNIFQKLGVDNRTEAVVKGIEKGIISSEDTKIL